MCGRFALCDQIEDIDETFGVVAPIWLTPQYNIAPGSMIACLNAVDGETIIEPMHWGIIPHWAKNKSPFIINSREETVDSKPITKKLVDGKRCCILASGYYEWHKDADGHKQPYYIYQPTKQPFAMAGIWQNATREEDGMRYKQCSILTTDAVDNLVDIHHRMPVILTPDEAKAWMTDDSEEALHIMREHKQKPLDHYAVSDYVNNSRHGLSKCIEPLK